MIREKLKRAIQRSENAYQYYLDSKKYFQALRILKANQIIYELLNEFIYSCKDEELEAVETYIFHLEDWMHQFQREQEGKNLADSFVFERLEGGIPFPKKIKEILP